jgi:hypothetical protein
MFIELLDPLKLESSDMAGNTIEAVFPLIYSPDMLKYLRIFYLDPLT